MLEWHGDKAVSTIAAQQEGSGFVRDRALGSLCVEFARSACYTCHVYHDEEFSICRANVKILQFVKVLLK